MSTWRSVEHTVAVWLDNDISVLIVSTAYDDDVEEINKMVIYESPGIRNRLFSEGAIEQAIGQVCAQLSEYPENVDWFVVDPDFQVFMASIELAWPRQNYVTEGVPDPGNPPMKVSLSEVRPDVMENLEVWFNSDPIKVVEFDEDDPHYHRQWLTEPTPVQSQDEEPQL